VTWDDGRVDDLDQADVWHVRGPSWNGSTGMDAIKLLREAIGLAIATEETHARFHSNGAQPGGFIKTDKDLSDAGVRARLKEQFQQTAGGVANKFRTIVLDNGMKWKPMMTTGVDSQHLQLRQFQVEEICRGYCVMPIMVGYSGDKAPTFASAEQLFLQHLVHTVGRGSAASPNRRRPLAADREERARPATTSASSRQDFMSPRHEEQGGILQDRARRRRQSGWLTPNQVRAFDEMGPSTGGDHLFAPTNAGPSAATAYP
jgi:phage portal protein BeeE